MKRWISFLVVIGVATASTTTIVACGSSVTGNILSQSFNSSYKVDDFDNLASYGVTHNEEKEAYDFSSTNLTIGLENIIKPINDTVPVQKVSKDKTITVKSDELVAIYSAEDQNDLISKENLISIKFKLNLYKGVKQETNEVKLIDQNIEYDILLNIFIKPNLNFLITPTVRSSNDIDEFKGTLVTELMKQTGFSKIAINMVIISNSNGTNLTEADLVENNTHVKLTLTDEGKKEFIGEKDDLKVNWTPIIRK